MFASLDEIPYKCCVDVDIEIEACKQKFQSLMLTLATQSVRRPPLYIRNHYHQSLDANAAATARGPLFISRTPQQHPQFVLWSWSSSMKRKALEFDEYNNVREIEYTKKFIMPPKEEETNGEETLNNNNNNKENSNDAEVEHGSEEEDNDSDNGDEDEGGDGTAKKKKRKKKKKKKKKGGTGAAPQPVIKEPSQKPPHLGLKETAFTDFAVKYGQTDPPTIPVEQLFRGKEFPQGEIQQYQLESQTYRETSAEVRARDRLQEDLYGKIRWGAEVHRQVRNYAQSLCKPGIKLHDLCTQLENKNRELVQEQGLERGIGFPTGCSLNHVAAHYTPNNGDDTVLSYDDVMKLDFGVQIEGRIIDSAWTVHFNPRYDPLVEAVREATDAGIRTSGIDVRLCDVGEAIQEVMESYECELDGTTYPVKAVRNLNGHSIAPYQIHAGKSVPIIKNGCEESLKMEEGEVYAIETFGSTGRGYVVEDLECSHYMKRFHASHVPLRMQSSKRLLAHINKTFGTLAFCRRWLERDDGGSFTVNGNNGKQEKYMGALKNLCDVVRLSYE
jgi:methionyl aminopeptidase